MLLAEISVASAQNGCQIRVKLINYSGDTLWFGRTYGKRAQPSTFALKQADGWFELKNDSTLTDGVYAIIHRRAPKARLGYISCLLASGQRTFTLETTLDDSYQYAKVSGSPENEQYFAYMKAFYDHLEVRDSLNDRWRLRQDPASLADVATYEAGIRQWQEDFIKNAPGTIVAKLIAWNLYPRVSDPAQRFSSYRRDLMATVAGRPADAMRYPAFVELMDFLCFKLSTSPDSARLIADDHLKNLENDPVMFEYYFNYMINSYAGISRCAMDQVFVHMVHNYIEKNRAPWTSTDEMTRMQNDAAKLERLFIGMRAPDVTLFDKTDKPYDLNSIAAPHTLLVFWDPDCSHCKKELPILKNLYADYDPQSVKVIAICSGKADKFPMCQQFLDSQGMPSDWLYLGDPQSRTRFASLYNLKGFPRLYLLDSEKRIVYRRGGEVPEEELRVIFDRYFKRK